jgi:hypothetical protein
MSSILGTVWFTALVFIAGSLVGAPMWNWMRKHFPWNK